MHKFSPQNAHKLERPERYELLKPRETLRRFGLREGMTFIDVGAGTGFFTRVASEIVGSAGTVYATDISMEMIDKMRRAGVGTNVHLMQSKELSVPVPDGVADMVLASFVFHETTDRRALMGEIHRAAKAGAKILIIEWKKQDEADGPPAGERLDENELWQELRSSGAYEHGSLNGSHYYILAKEPEA